MDLSPFKLDIDELIKEFAEDESTTLAEMKRVWLDRKFSFIYEARPSTNLDFFMQSLYGHCLGRMFASTSLSHRLGALYCIYCLYETQPFKPPFRIYVSIGELKKLRNLLVDAKEKCVNVPSSLVERMLERNMFLFGYVDINEGCAQERLNELTDIRNAQIQVAYKKLLEDSPIERFLHLDMAMELDLQGLKSASTEYAKAKEIAIKEAAEVMDVEKLEATVKDKTLIGDVVEKISDEWNLQKEVFNQETGSYQHSTEEPEQQQQDDDEDFQMELDMLLAET